MIETEASLIDGLRAGNSTSFEFLVRNYSSRLLATASRLLGNEADAHDAVQDALVSCWRGISSFEGSSSLYTWLHRIVVRSCLAYLEKGRRRREVALADDERAVATVFEGLASPWSEPEPSVERQMILRRALQRALDQVPEDLRTVLLLRDVEEFSSREVSELLGVPDAAIRQRLHRARVAMAELLRPELCAGVELTCGGQIELLLDFIDANLTPDIRSAVAHHVEACRVCTTLLDAYRITIGIPRAIANLTAFERLREEWLRKICAAAEQRGS